MLPSRSRLERWNPDSLTSAGQAIKASGADIDRAVNTLATNVKTMPDTKAWSGDAHTAAMSMFNRARFGAAALSSYTTAVGQALADGAGALGDARRNLLNKADEIDAGGQLHVSELWVVLITGAPMTTEQAAMLEKRAQEEQRTVNGMLSAVGAADDSTASKVTSAARARGFEAPNPNDPVSLLPGSQPPADDVPDPLSTLGALQQATLRDTDMALTVRETKVETKYDPTTGEESATVTTIYMQDGSRHVRTVETKSQFHDRSPAITEDHYDKDGKFISKAESVTYNAVAGRGDDNMTSTTVTMADGTMTELRAWPDGRQSATVYTRDGRQADVPLNVFNHPILMAEGAAISGLEEKAKKGIPMLTKEAAENVRIGAKYGGPALAVAGALWDVAVAKTGYDRCVAAVEGVTSVTAGILGGTMASGTGPLGVMVASTLASMGGQTLGNWMGNTFCPR